MSPDLNTPPRRVDMVSNGADGFAEKAVEALKKKA
jgi:hypothetical protein